MFKNRLKNLRKEKNLTQKEIAKELDITQQQYAKWENGERNPNSETLEKLADYFNVTTDYLLGRENFNLLEEEKKIIDNQYNLLNNEQDRLINNLKQKLETDEEISPEYLLSIIKQVNKNREEFDNLLQAKMKNVFNKAKSTQIHLSSKNEENKKTDSN